MQTYVYRSGLILGKEAEGHGGSQSVVQDFWEFDSLAIVGAPNDETVAGSLLWAQAARKSPNAYGEGYYGEQYRRILDGFT